MEDDAARYLTKAQESLASATTDSQSERYNSCANRCYYACFQAAIAALLREGIHPVNQWSHKFVHAQFGGQLVHRRKRYAPEFRTTLVDIFKLRRIADYESIRIARADARQSLAQSQALVRAIAERESR